MSSLGDDVGPVRRTADVDAMGAAFEHLPSAAFLVSGPELRFAAANAAYRASSGHRHLIGRPVREVLSGTAHQELIEKVEQVYATEEPATASEWPVQVDDGDGRMSEAFVDLALVPLRSGSDRTDGVLLQQTDVTERVRARRSAEHDTSTTRKRYEQARDFIVDLQEALLPSGLPTLPQVRTSARYLVAGRDQGAGGDWFDAVPLPDGRLVLVVGDVVGHGVTASAAMGQLRAVLHAELLDSGDIDAALRKADTLARRTPDMRASTLCLAVLDPDSGRVHYSTCGHPPPLIVSPGGTGRYLRPSGGSPLGTGGAPAVATGRVEPGETIVLYSDGLVERPGRPIGDGMSALAEAAAGAMVDDDAPGGAPEAAADRICSRAVEGVRHHGEDDITVLAAERCPRRVGPLLREELSDAEGLQRLRDALQEWLTPLGPTDPEREGLDLALTELVTNVAEHAHRERPGGIARLDAAIEPDGVVQVVVSDDGRWRTPRAPAPQGGRGLWLAGAVVDDFRIVHGEDAPDRARTTVTLRRRLHRPVVLREGVETPPSLHLPSPSVEVTVRPGPPPLVLEICGDITVGTIDEVAARVETASRGGMVPIVIDLRRVELLASAGVQELFETRDRLARYGHELVLIATPASPAQAVLDLVGLRWQRPVDDRSSPTPTPTASAPTEPDTGGPDAP